MPFVAMSYACGAAETGFEIISVLLPTLHVVLRGRNSNSRPGGLRAPTLPPSIVCVSSKYLPLKRRAFLSHCALSAGRKEFLATLGKVDLAGPRSSRSATRG